MSNSFLPNLPSAGPFATLNTEERELLASYGDFRPVDADKVLIKEGDLQPNLYCVISGELEVRRASKNDFFIVASLFPGDSIGEMAIFEQAPASATVLARKFSQVWQITYEQLMQFIQDNPSSATKILICLLTILSRRLRQVDPASFRYAEKVS